VRRYDDPMVPVAARDRRAEREYYYPSVVNAADAQTLVETAERRGLSGPRRRGCLVPNISFARPAVWPAP